MAASGPSPPPAERRPAAPRIRRVHPRKSTSFDLGGPPPQGPKRPTSLHAARTRKEIALAELRELEVKRRREDLVDAGAVARRWADVLRRVRAGVLAVPSRVRARLPHLTAQDVEVLDRELRDALTALSGAELSTAVDSCSDADPR